MKNLYVSISGKTSKMGLIPNISLPPIKACLNCASCKASCYAKHPYRFYPNVRKAWDKNFNIARTDLKKYFRQIEGFLTYKQPRAFRWHVSGDILSQEYVNGMVQVALNFPDIKFLAFTKCFDFNYSQVPENLKIIFSIFPKMLKPRQKKGVAGYYWMQDGTETRIPKGASECVGKCENCFMCWNIENLKTNHVWNIKHK